MDWWRTRTNGVRRRLHALFEKLTYPSSRRLREQLSGRSSSEQRIGSTDFSRIFTDAKINPPLAASTANEQGTLVLRFTSSAGATLTVTEINEGCYLCCHEPSSSWLSRSSPEADYYQLADLTWCELADTLVPLLALGWHLEEFTPLEGKQQHLTYEEQSNAG